MLRGPSTHQRSWFVQLTPPEDWWLMKLNAEQIKAQMHSQRGRWKMWKSGETNAKPLLRVSLALSTMSKHSLKSCMNSVSFCSSSVDGLGFPQHRPNACETVCAPCTKSVHISKNYLGYWDGCHPGEEEASVWASTNKTPSVEDYGLSSLYI